MAVVEKYAISPPAISNTLNATTIHNLMAMPTPPNDNAREKTAITAIMAVQTTISMSRPHSKVE